MPDLSLLKEQLREKALDEGADLFGIASAFDLIEGIPEGFRPTDLMPSAQSLVVLGFHIPDGAIDAIVEGKTNYSYQMFGYTLLNRLMDAVTYKLSKQIERAGYTALPIPGRGTQYWETKPYYGPISFRHAAVAAGLGQFGWSSNFMSPEYGPRERVIAIITNAPLEKDGPKEPFFDCTKCMRCVRECPANAISTEAHTVKIGDITYSYGKFNCGECNRVAKGLTTKAWPDAPFNNTKEIELPENYTGAEFREAVWEKRNPKLINTERMEGNFGATFCSRCMHLCPAGMMKIRTVKHG